MNLLSNENEDIGKYPLIDYVFSILENTDSVNDAINALLEHIGQIYDLNMIAIKEVIPNEQSVKCTYEWSSDGKKELLYVERRFFKGSIQNWVDRYSEDPRGVWTYYNGDGPCLLKLVRLDRVEALLEIPIFKKNEYIGCIDFVDSVNRREWTEAEIVSLKQMCRILASYLFHMRDHDESGKEALELVEYDNITRLPQYELFLKELKKAVENICDMKLIIISSDISNFKYINEKYGYMKGNRLLKDFSEHVYNCSTNIISGCRAYSDNFIIVSKYDGDVDIQRIIFSIEKICSDFVNKSRDEFFDSNLVLNVGVSVILSRNDDLETAISNANVARKMSKELNVNNGCRCTLYNRYMLEELKQQAEYVSTMEAAIANNEFVVYFQPQVLNENLEIIGAEALVRWKKNNGELIYPYTFIPALEKDGCIVKMDYYVYEQVFKLLRRRLDEGKKVVPIGINISMMHFYQKNLVGFLEHMVKKYKISPELIGIEMTEQVYLSDMVNIGETIEELMEDGFSIMIDDFGTGYSSLNALTKYKINGIKLDRIFMKKTMESNDKVIISCIVDMAKKLKLNVLCEGVETEEQRVFTNDIGCSYIQGFYFSEPLAMSRFEELLDE